jgi:leucyl-tRNA synthetase
MPVDLYVGGSEHAVLHLLYARFWHKVLHDAGYVSTKEPFQRLFHQGMIHKTSFREKESGKYRTAEEVEARDGKGLDPVNGNFAQLSSSAWFVRGTDLAVETKLDKMSKSRYNVVNPDDMCAEYGADATRLYELFMGPLNEGVEWETAGVLGTRRFLDRAWRLLVDPETDALAGKVSEDAERGNRELERALHAAIKKVTQAVTDLRFNTAIAEMMVFVNEATKAPKVPRDWFEAFVKLLAPFAPHVAEELWQRLGHTQTIAFEPWPTFDEGKLARDTIVIAVQVNGKLRGQIEVPADAGEDAIRAAAKVDEKVVPFLEGKSIRREIYVKGKLVNLVV